MSEVPTLHPVSRILSDDDRRTRWLVAMNSELETARYALVNLPDDEGPESPHAERRAEDDRLADQIHAEAATARACLRRALDLIHARMTA